MLATYLDVHCRDQLKLKSPLFCRMVAMMQPDKSWVARWLRMQVPGEDERPIPVKPGLYAIMLIGEELGAAAERDAEEGGAEDAYQDEEEDEMDTEHKQVLASILGGGAASTVDRDDPAQREVAIASQAIEQDEQDNDV
jgi:hypothetical protein